MGRVGYGGDGGWAREAAGYGGKGERPGRKVAEIEGSSASSRSCAPTCLFRSRFL